MERLPWIIPAQCNHRGPCKWEVGGSEPEMMARRKQRLHFEETSHEMQVASRNRKARKQTLPQHLPKAVGQALLTP